MQGLDHRSRLSWRLKLLDLLEKNFCARWWEMYDDGESGLENLVSGIVLTSTSTTRGRQIYGDDILRRAIWTRMVKIFVA